MSIYEKYFVRGGACPQMHFPCIPSDAVKTSVCIDKSVVPEGIFGCVEWIVKDFVTEGLVAHNTGELHMFVGGDPKDYENLNAEIDFQLENDHFVFSENSFIFVPEGCAHNIVSVKGLKKPMLSAQPLRNSPAVMPSRAMFVTLIPYIRPRYAPQE